MLEQGVQGFTSTELCCGEYVKTIPGYKECPNWNDDCKRDNLKLTENPLALCMADPNSFKAESEGEKQVCPSPPKPDGEPAYDSVKACCEKTPTLAFQRNSVEQSSDLPHQYNRHVRNQATFAEERLKAQEDNCQKEPQKYDAGHKDGVSLGKCDQFRSPAEHEAHVAKLRELVAAEEEARAVAEAKTHETHPRLLKFEGGGFGSVLYKPPADKEDPMVKCCFWNVSPLLWATEAGLARAEKQYNNGRASTTLANNIRNTKKAGWDAFNFCMTGCIAEGILLFPRHSGENVFTYIFFCR